jgi:hypothetical protein
MAYIIRDWDKNFERDRSRQWVNIRWVPVPNKQGAGYRKIMAQKNGAEIFGCWNAIVQQASICQPRGDLSKYTLTDLCLLTIIPEKILAVALKFLSQSLDWIIDTEINDKNVNECQKVAPDTGVASSILFSSIKTDLINSDSININTLLDARAAAFKVEIDVFKEYSETMRNEFLEYWTEPNKSKSRMRFEFEKTWDLKRRLNTWASRDKNFNNKKRFGRQEISNQELQEQMERVKLT